MRRILKGAEPEHFRNWKSQFRTANGHEAVYDDLFQKLPSGKVIATEEYKNLRKSLLEEQGYICCYCEKAIGRTKKIDSDIEHFMPRNPDRRQLTPSECIQCRNAQLDYTNLMVSCLGDERYSLDHCNHKKDNWFDFALCVSPIDEKVEELFGFRADGKIYAIGSNAKGEALRIHLNLDSYVLREQRKAAYDAVMEEEFESEELLDDMEYITDTINFYKNKDTNGYYTPFCSMITYCLEHELLE